MSESVIAAAAMRLRTMADGSLRIEVEVEPRDAQAAFAMFGRRGAPMALAALQPGYAAVPDEPAQKKPRGGELSKLAGRWCREPAFAQFIRPVYDRAMGGDGSDWGDVSAADCGGMAGYARHCILVLCEIGSRAELDHDAEAAAKFNRIIRAPYMAQRDEVPA